MSEKMVSLEEEVERMRRFDAAVAEALKGVRLLGLDGRAGENLSGFSTSTLFQMSAEKPGEATLGEEFSRMLLEASLEKIVQWYARDPNRKPMEIRVPVWNGVVSVKIERRA